MLESIVIRNFAIIDQAMIDFENGMTALTGETGAGKSILLDAIQLVLGDRADSNSVKAGSDKADITVSFNIIGIQAAQAWLDRQGLDSDGECLLRRVVQSNGRSKAFINSTPVPLSSLRELGEMLVDLHGQHEHQSLQKSKVQRQLLDASLDEQVLLNSTAQTFGEWRNKKQQLDKARDQSSEKQQRIDLLKRYLQEFEELRLQPGELEQLEEEYQRQAHGGQILEVLTGLVDQLYENEQSNIQANLTRCSQQLDELAELDPAMKEHGELLNNALIQVQEAASELRSYQDRIDIDPSRLDWLNQRLSQAQGLARKHQCSANELVALEDNFRQELDSLELDEADIQKIEQVLLASEQRYLEIARRLTSQRVETAARLSNQITEVMQTLGMQGGVFDIHVETLEDENHYSSYGLDQVSFLVSANPGQPVKPLNKVASGGELSRISLAIQVILSQSSEIPTLIFDEVDSGIGGGIAEIVGRKLRQIAENRQVFCVTHLPQVASQAHQHYQVNKTKDETDTRTDVVRLDQEQRLEEIARMLGGMTITDSTRAHAREMIGNA